MTLSIATANNLLGSLFGTNHASWAPPSFQLGLSLYDPTPDGSGLVEPRGNGYGRVVISNVDANWTTVNGQTSNANLITFPTSTGSWGQVAYWVLFDNLGTYMASGQLSAPTNIPNGNQPDFPIGSLVIQEF